MKLLSQLRYPVTQLTAGSQWQSTLRTAGERLSRGLRDGLLFRVRTNGRWYYSLTEAGLLAIANYE